VLIALIAAALGVWYRATYHSWPGLSASERVHWCGRDYELLSGPAQTWAQISAQQAGRIHVVGVYPPLSFNQEQLLSATDLTQAKLPAGVYACATELYVRTAPGRYQTYSLLGGP
jgi:hypothetical protein